MPEQNRIEIISDTLSRSRWEAAVIEKTQMSSSNGKTKAELQLVHSHAMTT